MEPKFDGGRFDQRRWYVDGFASHWFSTEEDAKAAIALADQVSTNARYAVATEIRSALDKIDL